MQGACSSGILFEYLSRLENNLTQKKDNLFLYFLKHFSLHAKKFNHEIVIIHVLNCKKMNFPILE